MEPIKIEENPASKKKGSQTLLKLKKTRKKILTIILNNISLGALAKSIVTLSKEPSYTSHNQKWKGAEPTLNNKVIKIKQTPKNDKSLDIVDKQLKYSKEVDPNNI
jgi:hypothetical protein